jgi:serine O-acetyltransferase
MFHDLKKDLGRSGSTAAAILRETVSTPGMWAVIGYRFRRSIYKSRVVRPFRWVLSFAAMILQIFVESLTCIQLPGSAVIGAGLYLPHTGYIVVASRAVIGRNCTIAQGVTIGHGGGAGKSLNDCPVIGDRVYLGPGAILIGSITVGDDALIGAGAVVTRSVPPRGVVVGNPARIIARTGSFELISYPGMDQDSARNASLAELRRASSSLIDTPHVMSNGSSL